MNQSNKKINVPTHLSETLRYKQYKWNVTADLTNRAAEVASGKREEVAFLGIPIDDKSA